jgi:hypothetical protein
LTIAAFDSLQMSLIVIALYVRLHRYFMLSFSYIDIMGECIAISNAFVFGREDAVVNGMSNESIFGGLVDCDWV